MWSLILFTVQRFFSPLPPINCFFCVVVYKSTHFFLNTSYKGLILRRCTFVTWWLLLVWQVKSWFDPAHAVLARDHPEFSRSQSWEIIRRQSWMTLSSFLIGRQAAWGAGCNQDTQRSSIWQRTSLQILRNKQIIRESTFFCSFFRLFKSTNLKNRTNTHSNEGPMQANDTTLRSTSDFSSPQPQESSVATQTGIQSRADDASAGHLKLVLVWQNATEWSRRCCVTQDSCHGLQVNVRKEGKKRASKQVVGQPNKQTKKTLWTLECHVICLLKYKNIWFKNKFKHRKIYIIK